MNMQEETVVSAEVQETVETPKEARRREKAEKKAAKKQAKIEKEKARLKAKGKKRRWRWGDRSDGYRVHNLTPYSMVSPYIMQIRSDSQNHFEEEIDITEVEEYIRTKRKEGLTNFGLLHVILAAYVRGISQRPAINRFIAGDRIYSRNNIEIVMVIKKQMTSTAPDTAIKCYFEPEDTIEDIYAKWSKVIEDTMAVQDSSFDKTAKALSLIPGLLLRWGVRLLRGMDYFGLLPKFLLRVSPFHGSMIITSMGSLGIGPIYHHLYDFGNLPVFLSYGKKYTRVVLDDKGNPEKRHFIGFRAVTDERICDGFYYASAFKIILHGIKHPKSLETPPEKVYDDVM